MYCRPVPCPLKLGTQVDQRLSLTVPTCTTLGVWLPFVLLTSSVSQYNHSHYLTEEHEKEPILANQKTKGNELPKQRQNGAQGATTDDNYMRELTLIECHLGKTKAMKAMKINSWGLVPAGHSIYLLYVWNVLDILTPVCTKRLRLVCCCGIRLHRTQIWFFTKYNEQIIQIKVKSNHSLLTMINS